jgi:polysaccharide biosynthesis protein PslH
MSVPRTLFLSTYAPALGGGRALRTYTTVRALAMLGPVDLAYVAHEGKGPSPEYQAIDGIAFHEVESSRGPRRAAVYLAKRLEGIPSACCRGTSPELIEVGEALARAPQRGQVIVGDVGAATALMPMARRREVIYNAHNVESDFVGTPRAGHPRVSHEAMVRYERRLLGRVTESWMVSHADIRSARKLLPDARLRYAPNVVDVSAIEPVRRAPDARGERLLMVGDFHYQPNLSGLEFLVGEVLPIVWENAPQVTLNLVGRGLENWTPPDPRVELAGYVPELAPAYRDADCVVVPLTEGAGTPLKFVEGLAYGMPLVATPLAAKGLDVTPDVHYREASDARSFAQAILDILRHGAGDLPAQARGLAERAYSIEALAKCIAPAVEREPRRASWRPPSTLRAVSAPSRWLSHAAGSAVGRRYPFALCYHGVGSIAPGSDPNGIFVSRELFVSHLDVMQEQHYEMLSVSELWSLMRHGSSAHGKGSITFDDGLQKTAREVVPLLVERGMACSMFIPTGLMGSPHPDLDDEMIVTAEQVAELAQAGVEIGAHSVDHVRLSDMGYEDSLEQLRRSRAVLEDILGKPVTSMAYPYGAYTARTIRAAAEAGYETACACAGPGPWRALSLPREPIHATVTPLRLRVKMAGLYGPVHTLVGEHGPLRRWHTASIR